MLANIVVGLALLLQEGVTKIPLLPPGPGNPRNSEGDFVELKDGRVLFVYTRFTGGSGDHAAAELASRVSSDGGRTWSAADEAVVRNEGGMNVMSVSLLRLRDGAIALFYLRKDSTSDCRAWMRRSTDEAKSWGDPVLCMPDAGYHVVNNDRVLQLSSGRLIIPAAFHGVSGRPGVAVCFLSDDGGKTWRRGKGDVQPPAASRTGLQEPLVVELKGRDLLMLSRTDQGSQFRSTSSDGGETWTAAAASDIVSPVSPASLKRIPKTGDLLLVWNDHAGIDEKRKGKRTPLTAAVSKDDGRTWEKSRVLEDDPDGWYCYTAIEFVGGRVLLAYVAGDTKVGRLNRTQIAHFEVEWLYR
jgi:Neuraminidase (sialidase)